MKHYTIRDFEREFPDDAACLEWLMRRRYPTHPGGVFCTKCQKVTKHHRVVSRHSYSCDECGHHVHPTANTIFHKSPTPLRLWFYAVYQMASTRCGISAKQIQRETGVTYKTAWRMFTQIRKLLQEEASAVSGHVEIDETYVGGKRHDGKRGRPGPDSNKTPVVGIAQRKGRVVAVVTKDVKANSLMPIIGSHVLPKTTVYTDELLSYNRLPRMGYNHKRIHHQAKVYVMGDIHTNTVEGFWSLLKRGISGVYHSVSAKQLQSYVDEYAFRYNHRNDTRPMFSTILSRAGVVR